MCFRGLECLGRPGRGGVVVAAAHIGQHRLIGPALAALGWPVTEVTLPPGQLEAELPTPSRVAAVLRRHTPGPTGTRKLAVNRSLRPAVRALRAGELVVNPGDGRWGRGWCQVPFLTGSARFATGPGRLADLGAARLVWACVGPGHTVVLAPGPSGDPPTRAAWFARQLEARVRSDPASYLWRLGTLYRLQAVGREHFFTRAA